MGQPSLDWTDWLAGLDWATSGLRAAVHPLRYGDKAAVWTGWPDRASAEPGSWSAWDPRTTGYGIVTTGLLVVDVDSHRGGDPTAQNLAAEGLLPKTLTVQTPHGWHLYYRHDGEPPTSKANALGEGVDVKAGPGAYVVGPGSSVWDPNEGSWGGYRVTRNVPVATAPAGLLARCAPRAGTGSPLRGPEPGTTQIGPGDTSAAVLPETTGSRFPPPIGGTSQVPVGQRHDTIRDIAWHLRQRGVQQETAEALIRAFHAVALEPSALAPYPVEDALRLVGDAYRQKPNELLREVDRQRIREQARRILRAESAAAVPAPELIGLADLLAEPALDMPYRVSTLLPIGGNALLVAQAKAGKTTLEHHLLRCLADGDTFLGAFPVLPPTGRIVVADFEMGRNQLAAWMRVLNVRNPDRVVVMPLRGLGRRFGLLDDDSRSRLAAHLRSVGCSMLMLDPMVPLMLALGLRDENATGDVGQLLDAIDALKAEAGIGEAMLVHHAGWENERARGASRLADWPDATWLLVAQRPDTDSDGPQSEWPRFLSAYGRDVELAETAIVFDPATRLLTLGERGHGRGMLRRAVIRDQVLTAVKGSPGVSANEVVDAVAGRRTTVLEVLRELVAMGKVRTEQGDRKTVRHYVADDPAAPNVASAPEQQYDAHLHVAHPCAGCGQTVVWMESRGFRLRCERCEPRGPLRVTATIEEDR